MDEGANQDICVLVISYFECRCFKLQTQTNLNSIDYKILIVTLKESEVDEIYLRKWPEAIWFS